MCGFRRYLIIRFSLISAIVTLVLMCMANLVQARTVALVFDDSGSMGGEKELYANFAVQTLTALLRDNDKLLTVTMSEPDKIRVVKDRRTTQGIIDQIHNRWFNQGGRTPYPSVETAMAALEKATEQPQNILAHSSQDWLIITTDGAFSDSGGATLYLERVEKTARDFLNKTRGRVRVAFLLIGHGADQQIADIWKKIAPEQVQVFKFVPQEFDPKMRQVAALITGRDFSDADIQREEKKITFSALFPIKRITIFEQDDRRHSAAVVQRIELPIQVPNTTINLKKLDVRGPRAINRLTGRITHGSSSGVLPSGKYTIHFDRPIAGRQIQVLLESAVDFKVLLLDQQNHTLKPDKANRFSLCENTTVKVRVDFQTAGSNQPLPLNQNNTQNLELTAKIGGKTSRFKFDPASSTFLPLTYRIKRGAVSLSVIARSPGYFNLKSNIFTLEGKDCGEDVRFEPPEIEVSVPYIFATQPKPTPKGASFNVVTQSRKPKKIEEPQTIKAQGLPAGVELEVFGETLTQKTNQITVPHFFINTPIPVTVRRSRDFQSEKPIEVYVTISSKGVRLRWPGKPLVITLKPQSRNIAIVNLTPNWRGEVMNLEKAPPITVTIQDGGQAPSSEEFSEWTLDASGPARLQLVEERDDQNLRFMLCPRPYFCSACWTATGRLPIKVTARGPIRGENARATIYIQIDDVQWWKKCLIPIIAIISLIILLAWIYGIIIKPRFGKEARFMFLRVDAYDQADDDDSGFDSDVFNHPGTETKYISEAVGGKIKRFLLRWIVPYVWFAPQIPIIGRSFDRPFWTEKAQVSGFQFLPERETTHVCLPKGRKYDNEKPDLYIDGQSVEIETWAPPEIRSIHSADYDDMGTGSNGFGDGADDQNFDNSDTRSPEVAAKRVWQDDHDLHNNSVLEYQKHDLPYGDEGRVLMYTEYFKYLEKPTTERTDLETSPGREDDDHYLFGDDGY